MKREEIANKLLAALVSYGKSKSSSENLDGLTVPKPGEEKAYLEQVSLISYRLQQPMISIGHFAKILRAIHLPAQTYFTLLEEIINQHVTNSRAIKAYQVTQAIRETAGNLLNYVSESAAELIKPAEDSQRSDFEKMVGEVLQECKNELKQFYLENEVEFFSEKIQTLATLYIELSYKIDMLNIEKSIDGTFEFVTSHQDYAFKNEYQHHLANTCSFLKTHSAELPNETLDKIIIKFKLFTQLPDHYKFDNQLHLKQKTLEVFGKAIQEKRNAHEANEKVLEQARLRVEMGKLQREIVEGNRAHEQEKQELEEKLKLTAKNLDQQHGELVKVQRKTDDLAKETEQLKLRLAEAEKTKTPAKEGTTLGFDIRTQQAERDKSSIEALNQIGKRRNRKKGPNKKKGDDATAQIEHVSHL